MTLRTLHRCHNYEDTQSGDTTHRSIFPNYGNSVLSLTHIAWRLLCCGNVTLAFSEQACCREMWKSLTYKHPLQAFTTRTWDSLFPSPASCPCPCRWGDFQLGLGSALSFLTSPWILANGIQTQLTFLASPDIQSDSISSWGPVSSILMSIALYSRDPNPTFTTSNQQHHTGHVSIQNEPAFNHFFSFNSVIHLKCPLAWWWLLGDQLLNVYPEGLMTEGVTYLRTSNSKKREWRRNKLLMVSFPVQWHLNVKKFLHSFPTAHVEASGTCFGFGHLSPNVFGGSLLCQTPVWAHFFHSIILSSVRMLSSLFYRWNRHTSFELNVFSQVTQLLGGRIRLHSQISDANTSDDSMSLLVSVETQPICTDLSSPPCTLSLPPDLCPASVERLAGVKLYLFLTANSWTIHHALGECFLSKTKQNKTNTQKTLESS